MGNSIVSAAQVYSIKGDVESNIQIHLEFVKKAIEHDADLIVFPELSLTGYELRMAEGLAIDIDDNRLQPFYRLARQENITIIAGAPIINLTGKPYIGALIFSPENLSVYKKQYLHTGEDKYISPGQKDCLIDINGEHIGLAICADIANPAHPEAVALKGATIYAAGVLITREGYANDAILLKNYALKHNMTVVLANYCEPTGGFIPAGKSAIWNEKGQLVAVADESNKCLVVAKKESNKWTGKIIVVQIDE